MAFSTLGPIINELATAEGELAAVSSGLAAWTTPTAHASSTFQPTSGVAYFFRFRFQQAGTPANIYAYVTTVGATLTAADNVLGVYDTSGNLLCTSADCSTSWTSLGQQGATLAYTPGFTEGGVYYAALLAVGGTTPIFASDGTTTAATKRANSASAARLAFSSGSSLTALPATVTVASGTDVAKTVLIGVA